MKNKLYKSYIALAAIVCLGLFGCENNEPITASNSELKFLPAKSPEPGLANKKSWWVIADFDWGRESRDCKGGFGVCNWDWFPGWDKPNNPVQPGHVQALLDYDDTLEAHYVEILLDQNSIYEPYLYIDNDISAVITIDKETEIITFPAGAYAYDSALGDYGGYRIDAN